MIRLSALICLAKGNILAVSVAVFLAGIMLFSVLASAAPTRLVADLSESHVDITSDYHGTELLLFGAYEGQPGDDLILEVRGPASDIAQRRKEQRAGIWVNVETWVWQQVPSFYHIFATRQLDEIATRDALMNVGIGRSALELKLVAGESGGGNGHGGGAPTATNGAIIVGTEAQTADLDRNMQGIGLWAKQENAISTQQDMLFRANLALPSNVPSGDYKIRVVHFRGGVAISERTTDMNVRKAGLSALIYRFAHEYSVFYGLFAIVFAVASGWLAAAAFRRS